jgi:hypothetical protein
MTTTTPPKVVVEAGDLACGHQGTRKLDGLSTKPGAAAIRLTVKGSPVVPVDSAGGSAEYTDCTVKDSNGNKQPCNSTTVSTPGAAKLTVGGKHVMLDGDTVLAVNPISGPAPATVHPGQTKLTAT